MTEPNLVFLQKLRFLVYDAACMYCYKFPSLGDIYFCAVYTLWTWELARDQEILLCGVAVGYMKLLDFLDLS